MKTITTHDGKLTIVVDDEDCERLRNIKWYNHGNGSIYGNVRFNPHDNVAKSSLAAYVMRNKNTMYDHINRNFLDNRKENLRESSYSQNGMNRSKQSGTTSRYKGVSWCGLTSKWRAQIMINGHTTGLGYFFKEEDAARAYDSKAAELFGEFANLNFIMHEKRAVATGHDVPANNQARNVMNRVA